MSDPVPSLRLRPGSTAATSRRLSRPARIALDGARAASAVYVVVYHVAQQLHLPRLVALPLSFGQEAVIVFFLLSGFVIFANERDRVQHPGPYYLRRVRRIYPPILVAMAVSTVLWAVGAIHVRLEPWSILWTLLSVQDVSGQKPGVISDPYLQNDPLWSLSYEVFFYLVFPLVMVAWRRSATATRLVVPVVCVAAYALYLAQPNHLALVVAYFMLWWTGAMAAEAYRTAPAPTGSLVRRLAPELLGLAAVVAVALVGVAVVGSRGIGLFPVLPVRHFAIGLVIAVIALTPARRLLVRAVAPVARPVVFTASISYGLYVVHYPILVQTGVAGTWWIVPAAAATVAVAWAADVGLGRLLGRRVRPGA